MDNRVFKHPFWCNRIFNYLVLLPFGAIFYIEARSHCGISFPTLGVFLFLFMIVSYSYYYHGRLNKTIEVNEKGIKGFAYNNLVVEIEWGEGIELMEERRCLTSWFRWFRLVGNSRDKEIVFLENIEEFNDLMSIINQRALNLKRIKRRYWI